MTNHVVLFEPLMPANTGNIARSCAGTNTVLHLIEPLGFLLDDKHMKRAGLDYWDDVKIEMHDDLPSFLATLKPADELYLISKFSSKTTSITPIPTRITTSCLVRKRPDYPKLS